MTLQSVISIVTVALIVARAVNILKQPGTEVSVARPGHRPVAELEPGLNAVTAAVIADRQEPAPTADATSRFPGQNARAGHITI